MPKAAIREKLRTGGAWLGAARDWLLWYKDHRGSLTWGSDDVVSMTVRELEELALEVATVAIVEFQKRQKTTQD
jgi:hypothetical protein